jgi:hypothetical protein
MARTSEILSPATKVIPLKNTGSSRYELYNEAKEEK